MQVMASPSPSIDSIKRAPSSLPNEPAQLWFDRLFIPVRHDCPLHFVSWFLVLDQFSQLTMEASIPGRPDMLLRIELCEFFLVLHHSRLVKGVNWLGHKIVHRGFRSPESAITKVFKETGRTEPVADS